MKSKTFKSTLISSAVAIAMGLSAVQLHATEGQAGAQPNPAQQTNPGQNVPGQDNPRPTNPGQTSPGQITEPSDGRELIDDVNRGTANTQSRRANLDPIDADDFVETASAKGHAEISTARLALEDGSPALRAYANKIIEDHTAANSELKAIAARADLDVADDATLMDRARVMMLSVRSGDSFDAAFIENQIESHEDSIELFERAAMSDHPQISAFAREKISTLQEHLRMAHALRNEVTSQ
ncbi:MAG: DUF4142 domain-containing protein [Pseudohongiella sp.]|nr:DUF4142 domain-containing protein [Pseudohongiella sp.]MDO9521176.1 DUF4142 domain-containing protein [Pseudohongiella sp.]MDP2127368.1 DUF4142 domain-containing protein [Pseudohongiella sp.]